MLNKFGKLSTGRMWRKDLLMQLPRKKRKINDKFICNFAQNLFIT